MRQAQKPISNSGADEQIWLLTQRELFKLTEAGIAGKIRKLPCIEVYFRTLATAAAKGDTSAIAEQRYFIKKLGKLGALNRPAPKPEQHPLAIEIEKRKAVSEIGNKYCSAMYLTMTPDFFRRYECRYGKQDYDRHVKPYWLDYQPVLDRLNVILARLRRKASVVKPTRLVEASHRVTVNGLRDNRRIQPGARGATFTTRFGRAGQRRSQ